MAEPKITKPTVSRPKTSKYTLPEYSSQYQGQIDNAVNKVTNRQDFTYDPLKDVNYQAMAKMYQQQGEQAAKNTLGDAAALNGGFGSSYAITASQQARNDYNQQLASQIPALYDAAYNRYMDGFNMDLASLDVLRNADDTAYGRYRDNVSDKQWRYDSDYQAYRDNVADSQWKSNYNRDAYEFNKNYGLSQKELLHNIKMDKENLRLAKKSNSSGRGGNSGRGYTESSYDSGFDDYWKAGSNGTGGFTEMIRAYDAGMKKRNGVPGDKARKVKGKKKSKQKSNNRHKR